MYKSPIELIVSQFQDIMIRQQDDNTWQAIQSMGINVDKEELLKALKYDRDQYEQGYQDGYKEGAREMLTKVKEALIGYIGANYIDSLYTEMVGENYDR